MNIKKMLPYLCKEDLDSLLEACANGEITAEDFKITDLYPFLDSDQLMKILRNAISGTIDVSPKGILPFLDEQQIGILLEELEQKEFVNLKLDDLLPYLEENHIRRLFSDFLEKAKKKID